MRKTALILTALLVMSCSDNDQDIKTTNQECPKQECPSCEKDCVNDTDNGWCGDGICDSDESCNSCEKDCGQCKECPALECDGKECPSCPSCEVCQKCETCPDKECPALECDGKECPSCPSCEVCQKCETCPSLECDGKECPSCPSCQECDKSELEEQIKNLNFDLSRANEAFETQKKELETQIQATETCTGDLDECSLKLTNLSKRNAKSGSRLKFYTMNGSDGSQYTDILRIYDSKIKKDCGVTNFDTSYGCEGMIYCVPEGSVVDPENNFPYSGYCQPSLAYRTDLLTQAFLKYNYYTIYQSNDLYTDSSCTQNYTSEYVIDDSCNITEDTLIAKNKMKDITRTCIDGTTIESTTTDGLIYYKPISATFTSTLYTLNYKNECYPLSSNHVISVKELSESEFNEEINKAKQKRKEYCQNYCKEVERIAKDYDWVKLERKFLEE